MLLVDAAERSILSFSFIWGKDPEEQLWPALLWLPSGFPSAVLEQFDMDILLWDPRTRMSCPGDLQMCIWTMES
jgi:hypothetical protein